MPKATPARQAQPRSSSSRDLLLRLPNELLGSFVGHVLEGLTPRERQRTHLCRLSLIGTGWQKLAESIDRDVMVVKRGTALLCFPASRAARATRVIVSLDFNLDEEEMEDGQWPEATLSLSYMSPRALQQGDLEVYGKGGGSLSRLACFGSVKHLELSIEDSNFCDGCYHCTSGGLIVRAFQEGLSSFEPVQMDVLANLSILPQLETLKFERDFGTTIDKLWNFLEPCTGLTELALDGSYKDHSLLQWDPPFSPRRLQILTIGWRVSNTNYRLSVLDSIFVDLEPGSVDVAADNLCDLGCYVFTQDVTDDTRYHASLVTRSARLDGLEFIDYSMLMHKWPNITSLSASNYNMGEDSHRVLWFLPSLGTLALGTEMWGGGETRSAGETRRNLVMLARDMPQGLQLRKLVDDWPADEQVDLERACAAAGVQLEWVVKSGVPAYVF